MVDRVSSVINDVLSQGRGVLLEPEALRVCGFYDIPVVEFRMARSVEEAIEFSEDMGFPVVLKIVSPQILHKSDAGGVMLDLKTPKEVEESYLKIVEKAEEYRIDAEIIGVLVQERAPPSTEVVIGSMKDPAFGPVLMFGLGGIFVEVFEDVSFRVAPLNERDAFEMIREVKAFRLLEGIRGREAADVDALVEILLKVSKLVTEHKVIDQLDLNPILVYGEGAKAVDARIILSKDRGIEDLEGVRTVK